MLQSLTVEFIFFTDFAKQGLSSGSLGLSACAEPITKIAALYACRTMGTRELSWRVPHSHGISLGDQW
jgi:hypothetical protein